MPKTCPSCGARAKKSLAERWHHCGACGFEMHRDLAAARVILGAVAQVEEIDDDTQRPTQGLLGDWTAQETT